VFSLSDAEIYNAITRLQCLAWAMPKSVMPSGAMKSAKLLRRKSTRIWQC